MMHTVANVKRTTLNLDQDLVRQAGDALGTSRMTDTVHEAMRDVIRRRNLEALTKLRFPDLTLEKLKEMRQGRSFDHLRD
jgi:Arc/MetJ family transcription regulator